MISWEASGQRKNDTNLVFLEIFQNGFLDKNLFLVRDIQMNIKRQTLLESTFQFTGSCPDCDLSNPKETIRSPSKVKRLALQLTVQTFVKEFHF